MKIALAVLLVALLVMPAFAEEPVLSLRAKNIEVNGLVGSIGVAGGVFWPVVDLPRYDIELGPMCAVGENTAVVGGGLKIGITINAPILENLNFAWVGYGHNWVTETWDLEYGLGVVVEIE